MISIQDGFQAEGTAHTNVLCLGEQGGLKKTKETGVDGTPRGLGIEA